MIDMYNLNNLATQMSFKTFMSTLLVLSLALYTKAERFLSSSGFTFSYDMRQPYMQEFASLETFILRVGDKLKLTFSEDMGTGYTWHFDTPAVGV